MDSECFDDVVKLLARGFPRHGAPALLARSGWGLAGLDEAEARKKKK